MPDFPVFDSRAQLQPQAASPLMNVGESPVLEAAKGFEKVASDQAERWISANDVMESNEAKAKHKLALADIESRAAADPDFKNSGKYQIELQAAKDNALSGIGNALVAKNTGLELDLDGKITGMKIDNQFRQKQLQYNQSMVRVNLDALWQKRVTAMTTAEGMQYEDQINALVSDNVKSGVLSMDEAKKIAYHSQLETATNLVYDNPDLGRKKIEEGTFNLLPKDKYKLLEDATNIQKRKEAEFVDAQKRVMFDTEASIATDIAGGKQVSLQELADGVRTGTISADFATVTMKALTSKDAVNAETDNEEFSKLTQEVFKAGTKDQVQKAIVGILKGGGDGKISKDDLGILINSAQRQAVQKRTDTQKAIESLGNWADHSNLNRAEVFRTFQQGLSEGKSVSDSASAAMRKTVNDNVPGASTLEDVPTMVIGKDSPIRLIFPKTTNVYPSRIYNQKTGKLEDNPDVKRSR